MEPDLFLKLVGTSVLVGGAIGGAGLGLLKNTFVTKKSCLNCQTNCATAVHSKIEEIKESIDKIAEKREAQLVAQADRDEKLFKFIGRVEYVIENIKA